MVTVSGIVWHTQGSGKSLTMVMLANYILHNINRGKSKVIIVTDRKELDKQIAKTFSNTKFVLIVQQVENLVKIRRKTEYYYRN